MNIDPLTVWHFQDLGQGEPLSRPLTADLTTADVIPGVVDITRRRRAAEPTRRLASRPRRRLLGRSRARALLPVRA